MPPAQQLGIPPPTEEVVVAPTSEAPRKTHIEVCVRLRPLTINHLESSNSFFEKGRVRRVAARKPQIPRPSSSRTTTTPTKSSIPPPTGTTYAWDVVGDATVTQSPDTNPVPGRTHTYTLDRVYGPRDSTAHLYQHSVQALVQAAVVEGYHTAVLAYGQTSTGKTHTMSGTWQQPGLIPLAIRECFDLIRHQQQNPEQLPREYLLRVSYLEVYKEHIRDLLAPNAATAPPVRLFDSGTDGLVIKGVHEPVVTTPEQVFCLLAQGESRRQMGATHLNQHSSRSHVLVRLWMESRGMTTSSSTTDPASSSPVSNRRTTGASSCASSLSSETPRGVAGGPVRVSSLSLVDLAGSESVRLSGSSDRRQEGHYINQSLMTLGKIVYALSEQQENSKTPQHIPYRDSKLTRLLQPSLSGNAQVALICCISPLASHLEESHNTFKFAMRAKKIPQKATITESMDDKTLLQSYREEIEDLKQQLKEAREQEARLAKSDASTHSTAPSTTPSLAEDEVQELVEAIQTMEKLILKSKPMTPDRPEDLLDSTDVDGDDDEYDEGLLALAYDSSALTPPRSAAKTPNRSASVDNDLHTELSRIQTILQSVQKKRHVAASEASLRTTSEDQEVRNLRWQLEQQEVATSLRKADASFLQAQLEQKDDLLEEVSKILEAMEQRQIELEAENAGLREELAAMKASK